MILSIFVMIMMLCAIVCQLVELFSSIESNRKLKETNEEFLKKMREDTEVIDAYNKVVAKYKELNNKYNELARAVSAVNYRVVDLPSGAVVLLPEVEKGDA